jgi:phosphoserine phosphatase RsbU/P
LSREANRIFVNAAEKSALHLPGRSTVRVLLIEDNPGDARLIEEMLAETDGDAFRVECVSKLAAGLERLDQDQFDVVLLDLSLPDSHGLNTFSAVHDRVRNAPVIVMSGLDDATTALTAVQAGAQDYLVKGHVDGHLLSRAIRYSMERKRIRQQLEEVAAELRAKNAQLEADLEMAREIQQVFLPHHYPTFPHSAAPEQSALHFSHRFRPATVVSGDFFSILEISDHQAGVFLCDVMGHGLRAALVTAIMRGLIEEMMPVAGDAGLFLTEINRHLMVILQRRDEPMLATAFYLVMDVETGEMQYASAGHPSPLLVSPSLQLVEPLRARDPRHGPALGLFEKSVYPNCNCHLNQRDLIMLYTDGLYEVEGPDEEEYGQERLLAAVQRRVGQPLEQMFDELVGEVETFATQHEFEDDVCLVGMELAHLL